MNLSTARISVRDMATAKSFYGELLGLPIKADDAASVAAGPVNIFRQAPCIVPWRSLESL